MKARMGPSGGGGTVSRFILPPSSFILALAREGWAMDAVKLQLVRIQQQLSGLTASQKMLTAALVAIMVMALVYWGRQAGTAEMAPVLDQPIAPKDIPPLAAPAQSLGLDP